ncbi:MAG: hypothetical protein COW48_00960 [Hydrogenophilales bacterium CG17_big_fil_post_rev_8_21_14_2_50_63_12]|nr:MAG: hypothetical protein COW48_00960 [Hydrogenophilales bacterium CG17_big_fil_post_rev_8_21_14_2_50_63_12]PIX95947.1 MAG: hypothetical protein COZ24_13140 [Hydrogenophilales bacterium CG_4_10_14_3_um_filter_63_21]
MQSLPRLVGLFIAMIPLVTNADSGQVAEQTVCPSLLMEQECHDYQVARRQAQSEAERGLLDDKYAALLIERSRLCPCSISPGEAEETKNSPHKTPPRHFAGRKVSM